MLTELVDLPGMGVAHDPLVYTGRARKFGQAEMSKALWRRAAVVYRCHVAMLVVLFTVIAWVGIRSLSSSTLFKSSAAISPTITPAR